MTLSSDTEDLAQRVARDPGLRVLSFAARIVWLETRVTMREMGLTSLRRGTHVIDTSELAAMVGLAPAEVASILEMLVSRGFLAREADGALISVPYAAKPDRSRINAENARSRWTKAKMHAQPDQREMPLMRVTAGGATPAECDSSCDAVTRTNSHQTPKLKPLSRSAKSLGDDSRFVAITRSANELAGLDIDRASDFGQVRRWLQHGATEELILGVIRGAARPGVRHLGYFSGAIEEAMAAETAASNDWTSSPSSVVYTQAVQDWFRSGRVGPVPVPGDFQPVNVRGAV